MFKYILIGEYMTDLLWMLLWINQNFDTQTSLLKFLRLSSDEWKTKYFPFLQEMKLNFANVNSDSLSIYDKIQNLLLDNIVLVLK